MKENRKGGYCQLCFLKFWFNIDTKLLFNVMYFVSSLFTYQLQFWKVQQIIACNSKQEQQTLRWLTFKCNITIIVLILS